MLMRLMADALGLSSCPLGSSSHLFLEFGNEYTSCFSRMNFFNVLTLPKRSKTEEFWESAWRSPSLVSRSQIFSIPSLGMHLPFEVAVV